MESQPRIQGLPGSSEFKPQEPATEGPIEALRANLYEPMWSLLSSIKKRPRTLANPWGSVGGAAGVVEGTLIMIEAVFPSSHQDSGLIAGFKLIYYIADFLNGESTPLYSRVHCKIHSMYFGSTAQCLFLMASHRNIFLSFLPCFVPQIFLCFLYSTFVFFLSFSFPAAQDVDIPKVSASDDLTQPKSLKDEDNLLSLQNLCSECRKLSQNG